MTNELMKQIVEETVEYLVVTEGQRDGESKKDFQNNVEMYANDHIRYTYNGLTEEEYSLLTSESVKEYHDCN